MRSQTYPLLTRTKAFLKGLNRWQPLLEVAFEGLKISNLEREVKDRYEKRVNQVYSIRKRVKPFIRGLNTWNPLLEIALEGLSIDNLDEYLKHRYAERIFRAGVCRSITEKTIDEIFNLLKNGKVTEPELQFHLCVAFFQFYIKIKDDGIIEGHNVITPDYENKIRLLLKMVKMARELLENECITSEVGCRNFSTIISENLILEEKNQPISAPLFGAETP